MILFLYGPDSFRLQQRLNVLKQGFIQKYNKDGLNVEILDSNNFTITDFRQACFSEGLFSSRRLVIVKDIFANNKNLQEQINNEIPQINKDNITIFTSLEVPKNKNNNQLFKTLLKADKVEEFKLLKPGQIYHWIQTQAKKYGAIIDNDATRYLGETIGNDLWRLDNELKKLTSFTKHITSRTVNLFIDSPLDDNIFNLIDALSNKNRKRALKLLHDQLASGANEFYLLTMLARQVKILLQVKQTQGQGLDLHPFIIKKAKPQSQQFSLADLKKLFQKLTEIDFKLKTSQGDAKLWLNLFVIDMCS